MNQYDELLIDCLKTNISDSLLLHLKILSPEQWELLLDRARHFRVMPFLFFNLKPLSKADTVPLAVMERLRSSYLESSARNMRLFFQLEQLLIPLSKKGIKVIILKGVHLAQNIYGNIALRPMADIDFLAKREDIAKIHDEMLEQGYLPSKKGFGTVHEHLPSYQRNNSIEMELHYTIAPPPYCERLDVKGLFKRAQPISIGRAEALALGVEDLVLHLCFHAGIHHTFENGIIPFLDLAKVISYYGNVLNWDNLIEKSKDTGADRCLYLMFSICRHLLGTDIPERLFEALEPEEEAEEMAREALKLVFIEKDSISPNVVRLFGTDSFRSKFMHFFRRLFPPPGNMLPEDNPKIHLLIWVYFARLKNLFHSHGRNLLKLIFKDKSSQKAFSFANSQNDIKDWIQKGYDG